MKIELTIEASDELIHAIIKEIETEGGNPREEKRREQLFNLITTKLKLKIAKELQIKFNNMILKANPY